MFESHRTVAFNIAILASLRSNSVTRQVNYKTFISWKVCGNPKNRTCGHPKNPRIQRKLCGLFHVANSSLNHSVWKSLKMSHSTLRATFTFWVDKSLLKMPKMVNFGEFLKTWRLRQNSVTRQVTFNRTKIGGKCQNTKTWNATFLVIFKHCDANSSKRSRF